MTEIVNHPEKYEQEIIKAAMEIIEERRNSIFEDVGQSAILKFGKELKTTGIAFILYTLLSDAKVIYLFLDEYVFENPSLYFSLKKPLHAYFYGDNFILCNSNIILQKRKIRLGYAYIFTGGRCNICIDKYICHLKTNS